jgi:hypothetical protein
MTDQPASGESAAVLPQLMFGGYLFSLILGAAGTLYGPVLSYLSAETRQPLSVLGALSLALLLFPFNLGSTVLIGFGLGTEILLNRAVEYLAVRAPALTRLHVTYDLGSVIMPLLLELIALMLLMALLANFEPGRLETTLAVPGN